MPIIEIIEHCNFNSQEDYVLRVFNFKMRFSLPTKYLINYYLVFIFKVLKKYVKLCKNLVSNNK